MIFNDKDIHVRIAGPLKNSPPAPLSLTETDCAHAVDASPPSCRVAESIGGRTRFPLTATPPDGFTPRQMIRLPNPKSCVEQSERPGQATTRGWVWKSGGRRHSIESSICPRRPFFPRRRRVTLCLFHFV